MGCAITLFHIRTFKNLYSMPKGNLDNIRDDRYYDLIHFIIFFYVKPVTILNQNVKHGYHETSIAFLIRTYH